MLSEYQQTDMANAYSSTKDWITHKMLKKCVTRKLPIFGKEHKQETRANFANHV
jgi:hypothetical protein